ncbi:hypothetical protein [Tsukamurella strandjordii]|uniref:Uncharacterized protein n=1 Tax=Tsukamurella strandjordii TaxID=147577 RepID=A0AA90SM69_9ACTN|nr:hypothetical protein [Tsukamurella strandjordii]MDP0398918.1 hypothetical protein [Tsukamurella strandjordii]
MTISEAVEHLTDAGVPLMTEKLLRRASQTGELVTFRVGTTNLYSQNDLRDYLLRQRRVGTSTKPQGNDAREAIAAVLRADGWTCGQHEPVSRAGECSQCDASHARTATKVLSALAAVPGVSMGGAA